MDGDDPRVPIAAALVDVYGEGVSSDRIVELVRTILPIERLELA